jgi:CheY-like chemotaxis protein
MKPWKILAVDDESMILAVHRAYLERMGHEVVACADSRDALSVYQRHQGQFDMLLTDYRMPHVNGVQLTQMLRLFDEKLPVLMITGFKEEINAADLLAYQITCLSKPVRYEELCLELEQLQERIASVSRDIGS